MTRTSSFTTSRPALSTPLPPAASAAAPAGGTSRDCGGGASALRDFGAWLLVKTVFMARLKKPPPPPLVLLASDLSLVRAAAAAASAAVAAALSAISLEPRLTSRYTRPVIFSNFFWYLRLYSRLNHSLIGSSSRTVLSGIVTQPRNSLEEPIIRPLSWS